MKRQGISIKVYMIFDRYYILRLILLVPVVSTVVDELIVNVGVDPVIDGGTVPVVMIVVALDGV
jgi:hypothetical protein